MWDEPDPTIEDDEDDGLYTSDPDPVTAALHASGFAHRHTIADCVMRSTDDRVTGFPEMFERYYFDAQGGPVLVDLLADDSPAILAEERQRVHADFKARWCEAHDLRYLPLPTSDLSVDKIRRLLAGALEPEVSKPASQRKTTAKRGQIQRPKAAA